jgi:probable F420-dependent oxidoreductase
MEFILGLPTDHVDSVSEFGSGIAISEIANAVEKMGYFGVFVTDHPAPPQKFIGAGGHHTLDPLITLTVAGTATQNLRLLTNLYILPYRNPFLSSKAISTLDNLTNGRLILGVGAGYLKEEFDAIGSDYKNRGETLNCHLRTLLDIWKGEPVSIKTNSYNAHEIVSLPSPSEKEGETRVPLWVGGNSRNAKERVIAFADGWLPMATPKGMDKFVGTSPITSIEDLKLGIQELYDRWEKNGRSGKPQICIEPWDAGKLGSEKWEPNKYAERIDEFSAIGVTHIPVMLSAIGRKFNLVRSEFLQRVNDYADLMKIT